MKRCIVAVICLLLPHIAASQKIDAAIHYDFSVFNFSQKFYSSSILTWRDMYMHGIGLDSELTRAPFGFDTVRVHTGLAVSFQGYHTDDDTNNELDVIHVMSSGATMLDVTCELANSGKTLSPRLGAEFVWLRLEQYDYKRFNKNTGIAYRKGKINEYDMLKLDIYFGGQIAAAHSGATYFSVTGQAGIGAHLDLANWILRTDIRNPFFIFGALLKGEGGIECGLMFRGFTLFCALQASYEISPWLSCAYVNLTDGSASSQTVFAEYSRAVASAGIRARF